MDRRRSILIIINAAHKSLSKTLVENEDDLGRNLRAQEHRFFHAVAGAWLARGTRAASSVAVVTPAAASAGAGCVGVGLFFPFGEVLGRLEGFDGGGGLGVAAGTVEERWVGRGCAHVGHARVTGVGGCDEERVDALACDRVSRCHLGRSGGASGWKGRGEVRGNLRREHAGGG